MTAALQGVKVLDLSRFIAGPLCGMVLADLGADVVKVERRGKGEDARAIGPFVGGESLYTLMYNRNKRSLTLDYRNAAAQCLLREMIVQADVIIENFRPGTMEKMGCDWETVQALNPRAIMVRISGFGQDGPYAERPCFDVIAQAMSGLMEMTGTPDGPPVPSGTFLVDQVTGLYAAIGALAALTARERTGRGQLIDTALLDAASTLLQTAIPEKVLLGRETGRHAARDRYSAPANNYLCSDGRWVHFNAGNDIMFPRLAALMDSKGLLSDPRFATHKARMENAPLIDGIVADWVSRHEAEEVVTLLAGAEVPCGKVATVGELVANPQLKHRRQIIELDHPTIGKLPMAAFPARLSANARDTVTAAPSIGQHTDDVLKEWLHMDRDRIAELRAAVLV